MPKKEENPVEMPAESAPAVEESAEEEAES